MWPEDFAKTVALLVGGISTAYVAVFWSAVDRATSGRGIIAPLLVVWLLIALAALTWIVRSDKRPSRAGFGVVLFVLVVAGVARGRMAGTPGYATEQTVESDTGAMSEAFYSCGSTCATSQVRAASR